MELQADVRLEGRYVLTAGKIDGSGSRDLGFGNLITNNGLDMIGTEANFMAYCQVGCGTAEPNITDTALTVFHKSTSLIQVQEVVTTSCTYPFIITRSKTFRFAAGVITSPISEVGVGSSTSSGNLFSKALIKDVLGNPTTITLSADEYLDVTYFLDLTIRHEDKVSTLLLNGQEKTVTLRPYRLNFPNEWSLKKPTFTTTNCLATDAPLADVVSASGYTQNVAASSVVNDSYILGSYRSTHYLKWNGSTSVSFPIGTIIATNSGFSNWQINFSPSLTKPVDYGLGVKLAITWGRD